MYAFNRETGNKVTLSAVIGMTIAIETSKGVINTDAEVLREKIVNTYASTKSVDGSRGSLVESM